MCLPWLWLCAAVILLGSVDVAGEVTAVKAQKRSRKRVNVYLDGEYAFSLKVAVAASLKAGDYLSDAEIAELQKQDCFEKAYDRVLNYLAYRPRSNAEVRRYLKKKRVPLPVSEEVLERLTAAGFLDDEAFARYWVENRETFKPRGRRLLRHELRQKGVDYALISEALADVDEGESAYRAACKRASRYIHLDDELFRKKMYGFLRRRGFGYDVVRETLSRVLQCRSDERADSN